MPEILYYSTFCERCADLLNLLAHKKPPDVMYFSVDTREVVNNVTYLILSNGSRVVLPVTITKVPALLCMDEATNKNIVIFGKDLYTHFNVKNPEDKSIDNNNVEVQSYRLTNGATFVTSDTFSFLNTDNSDLMAQGDGGLQQLHHYSALDAYHNINTPNEDYTPNTIGNDKSLEDFKKERDHDLRSIMS